MMDSAVMKDRVDLIVGILQNVVFCEKFLISGSWWGSFRPFSLGCDLVRFRTLRVKVRLPL